MIELVDMCSLQNPATVHFNKMADSGVRGVWFKASQFSKDVDVTFDIGVERARKAGLAVGAYHFCYLGSDPVEQMNHFAKSAKGVGCSKGDLPAMIDWEYAKNGNDGKPLREGANVNWLVEAANWAQFRVSYTHLTLPTICSV